ncbi:hypothetical protein E5676_scaffold265G00730 [Cucumis melo var. makuwa]|uniref:Ty3-gypsy retrotransposon protein n=1 Tax=Cucumis melo var. makuwa TaxID=1194695 RepID=A0A5D3C7R9_CUCMM|nr:hypothetical protein E5676_scaffold265G00730 [Cucumis melo var. makuwa]
MFNPRADATARLFFSFFSVQHRPAAAVVDPNAIDHPQPSSDRVRQVVAVVGSPSPPSTRVEEVTFEFKNFTASAVEVNSPLLGWIRLDADLNEILATFQVRDFLLLDLGLRLETYLCAIICNELFTDRHRCPNVLCIVVMLVGYVVNWYSMSMDYKVLRLCCGVMVSFIYGIVYLTHMCKGTARGKPTRARRMREGHMDASGFLYASADHCILELS